MSESLLQPSHPMSASTCFSSGKLRRCNFAYSPCRHLCCAGRATRDTWGKRNAGWAGAMCHRHACRGTSPWCAMEKKWTPCFHSSEWIVFSKVRAVPLEMNFSCVHWINGTPTLRGRKHNNQRPSLSRGSSARHRQRLPCLLLANCLQLGGPRDLETSWNILKQLSRIAEILECKIPVEVIVIVLLDVYVADVVLVELVVPRRPRTRRWSRFFWRWEEKVCKNQKQQRTPP